VPSPASAGLWAERESCHNLARAGAMCGNMQLM